MQSVTELPVLPERPEDSHKGDYGRVFVLAGSPGMAGAASLSASAALRAGSGLVRGHAGEADVRHLPAARRNR